MFMENKIENGCSIDKYIKVTPASNLQKANCGDKTVHVYLLFYPIIKIVRLQKNFHNVFALLLIYYHA